LIDIQVCAKGNKRSEFGEKKEVDTELNGNFDENCLFIGLMQEEEDSKKQKSRLIEEKKEISLIVGQNLKPYDPVSYIED